MFWWVAPPCPLKYFWWVFPSLRKSSHTCAATEPAPWGSFRSPWTISSVSLIPGPWAPPGSPPCTATWGLKSVGWVAGSSPREPLHLGHCPRSWDVQCLEGDCLLDLVWVLAGCWRGRLVPLMPFGPQARPLPVVWLLLPSWLPACLIRLSFHKQHWKNEINQKLKIAIISPDAGICTREACLPQGALVGD